MNSRLRLSSVLFGLGLCSIGFFIGRLSVAPSPNAVATKLLQSQKIPAPLSATADTTPAPPPHSEAPSNAALRARVTQLSTAAAEEAACAELTLLAKTDPARALSIAETAGTPRQREHFRNAALQGWAMSDPEAASRWILQNVRDEERRVAVEAIALGAVAMPAEALRAITHLIEADPQRASDHGNALVNAFARAGQYELASQFAAAGPSEYRAAWLSTVYNQWANYQPQRALATLEKIPDAAARREAQAGLFAGWSSSDPVSFVGYAQTLPPGEDRQAALKDGLEQWVHLDRAAASAWMDNFDPRPDLDPGAAAIALSPALVAKKPDIAASWAESITDSQLRTQTLLDLLRLWAGHDLDGARRYAAATDAFSPDARQLALSTLEPAP